MTIARSNPGGSTTMALLKDGNDEPYETVVAIVAMLHELVTSIDGSMACMDLQRVCQDRDFIITSNVSRQVLLGTERVQFDAKGRAVMHDSVRHTVLSAIEGEGFNIQIVTPFAE